MKNDVNVPSKNNNYKIIFCWHLERHWRKEQVPDSLVRGAHLRIQIRTTISQNWNRNTGSPTLISTGTGIYSTIRYPSHLPYITYLTRDYCVWRVGEVRIAAARRRRRRGREPPKPPRLCSAPAAPYNRSRTRTPPPPERSTLSSRRIKGNKEVLLTFCNFWWNLFNTVPVVHS